MTIWFTSDLHLGHRNLIYKFKARPFSSIQEHDETLVNNYNSLVNSNDEVYMLGDLAYRCSTKYLNGILHRLKGKIYLVRGNHDKKAAERKECQWRFEWIKDLYTFTTSIIIPEFNKPKLVHITLCHYPLIVWPKKSYGSYCFSGHCHGKQPLTNPNTRKEKGIDIGVDCWDYKPVSLEQLIEMEKTNEMGRNSSK